MDFLGSIRASCHLEVWGDKYIQGVTAEISLSRIEAARVITWKNT